MSQDYTDPSASKLGKGGQGGQPAPGALSAHRVKAGLLAGLSTRAIARELGLSRQSVQEHARRQLLRGELVKEGNRYVPGPAMRPEGGGGHPRAHPPAGPNHSRLAHPPRIDVATDTRATFRVTVPPVAVDRVPGFLASKPKGNGKGRPVRQLLHHVAHVDPRGRTWNLWLDQSLTTGKWSLWTGKVAPPPRLAEFQRPGETPDSAVQRLATQVVQDWAGMAGTTVVFVKMSRPVAVTLAGTVPPGMVWKDGETTADGTPAHPNGWNTLELQGPDAERTKQQQEAHVRLPETTAKVDELEARLTALLGLIGTSVQVHEAQAVALARTTELAAGRLADGIAARPSPSAPSRPSPWDFV